MILSASKKIVLLVLFVLIQTSSVFVLFSQTGSALTRPLEPDCYNRIGIDNYTKTDCNSSGTTAKNQGKCFLRNAYSAGRGGAVNKEFDCRTGTLVTNQNEQQKCENSGGEWKQVGGQGGQQGYVCQCPTGKPYDSTAKMCVTSEEFLRNRCEESGGEFKWVGTADNGGLECVCPTGSTLERNRCVSPDEEGVDDPGSNDTTEESEVVQTDCKITTSEDSPLTARNCGIIRLLTAGINVLSAIAGMAIIASMMIGGYQYMTARDNSGQVEAAKKRITWALVALGLFIFMYAILNWLVPGGVL